MDEPIASHTPIEKVSNDRIMKVGTTGITETADFLNKEKDENWKNSIETPD